MISEEDVFKAAKLVRIRLTQEEVQEMQVELNSMIRMIEEMQKVDCTNIEPLVSMSENQALSRDDYVTDVDISDIIFSNIDSKTADFAKRVKCFVVPKVVE